ncbi:MAG: V-type ATPase 116kDa subunit family protein [Eubacteriales bacterium]|nr:V-type ATPase 116kDa subunit family protein [Eubacteriales bacterium]
MATSKMSYMTIIGMSQDRDAVLDALMKMGAIQVTEAVPDADAETVKPAASSGSFVENADLRNRLVRTIELVERRFPQKKPMFSAKPTVSETEFDMSEYKEELSLQLLYNFESAVERENELRSELNSIGQRREELSPWRDVPLDLSARETELTEIIYGTLRDQKNLTELEAELTEELPTATIFHLGTSESNAPLLAVVDMKEDAPHLRTRLSAYEFKALPTQAVLGTAKKSLEVLDKQADAVQEEIDRQIEIMKGIAEQREQLMLYHDVLLVRSNKAAVNRELSSTQYTFYFHAWVDANKAESVKQFLVENFEVACSYRAAAADEKYPIILKNNKFNESFEVVLEMYGAPSPGESDPMPVMGPFYMIIFGMMLSDVGYGLLLLLGCLYLIFKVKATGMMGQMARMLSLSAVSSIIWGFIFGGLFGDLLTAATDGRINAPVLWFDPMGDPIKLLTFSMFFGAIHLFAGMAVDIRNKHLQGDLLGGLLDNVPWYLIITAVFMILSGSLGVVSSPATIALLGEIARWMLIVGGLIVLIFAGRGGSWNPIVRIGKALLNVYNNATGFLSDILSYSRILALVLATSVIAQVVNILATGGSGIGGVLIFIIAGGLGHLLNLALSGLSAFVHAARLQYVEFFGKFFEGAGEYFAPFRRDTKYVEIDSGKVKADK